MAASSQPGKILECARPVPTEKPEDAEDMDMKEQGEEESITTAPQPPRATLGDIYSTFASSGTYTRLGVGMIFAAISGLTIPGLVFFVSRSIKELSSSNVGTESFLAAVRMQAYALMGLGGIVFVTQTFQHAMFARVAADMTRQLKTQWFHALLEQEASYYDQIDNVAGRATQLSAQAHIFETGLGEKLGNGIQFSFSLLIALLLAFISSWQTSLLILATLPVVALSMIHLFRTNQLRNAYASDQYATAGNLVFMTIASFKTIISLDMMDHQLKQFQAATSQILMASTSYTARGGMATGLAMAAFLAIFLVVALYGTYLLYDQVRDNGCDPSGAVNPEEPCEPQGADILGALLAIVMATWGLPQITDAMEGVSRSQAAAYPGLEIIKKSQEEQKKKDEGLNLKPDASQFFGNIEFTDVSFRYPTRKEQPIFKSLALNIPAGAKVAFVGGSGSGKSTIIQLVIKLYDPEAGSITLDGNKLQDLNQKWLRNAIGLVSQEPVLFSGTIRENICMGLPDATQEMVEEAARQANAHTFISQFPEGYDTILQGNNSQLSGGQKQRIAIARRLIRNPRILALDEATSALDSESEQVVQEALDQLIHTGTSRRTTLIVAHRLSTIKEADIIVVLKNGVVVEQGKHAALLEKKGTYWDLVQAQQAQPVPTPADEAEPHEPAQGEETTYKADRDLDQLEAQPNASAGDDALVEFRNAKFAYPARKDQTILRGLNLSIRKGETIGLCGPSGNGKSTLMQLVERFYDVKDGSVLFRGSDVKEINPRSLRKNIGFVSQEPTLFAGSILENIRFGDPSATKKEIVEAAKKANAHGFISAFSAGYDTEVGDSGMQMSGGQKQRIAIARALVRNPSVILLDEATSALDSESEKIVQEALNQIMNDKETTVIVIAHRLSTIVTANRIAVVSGGEVVEVGTHSELMNKPGSVYSRLYSIQHLGGAEANSVQATAHVPKQSPMVIKRPSHRRASASRAFSGMDLSGLSTVFSLADAEEEGQSVPKEPVDMSCSTRASDHFSGLFKRHRAMMALGVVGEIVAALVFPTWGLLLAFMIELLYTPVFPCDSADLVCQEYYDTVAEDMKERSIWIAVGCLLAMVASVLGQTIAAYGFGTVAERLTKEIRDEAFRSLLRQEPGFFDCRNAASLASLIEEDVSRINAMMGDPVRGVVGAIASIVTGFCVAFAHMWPVALLAIGVMPFKIFSQALISANLAGGTEDGSENNGEHSVSLSSSGLAVEVLSNMKTVASLSLEGNRMSLYADKLQQETGGEGCRHVLSGMAAGFAELVRLFVYAIIFWFGGWILDRYPGQFGFEDFLITMFVFLFSVSGLAGAVVRLKDRGPALEAACRVFALIERPSQIDSLSDKGKRLEDYES